MVAPVAAGWRDPAVPELLGLAVDLLASGDRRALTLLRHVLGAECGAPFAEAVVAALEAGAPPSTFAFLPAPQRRREAVPAAVPAALPQSGYVRAADVAAHFGVSVKAVYRWMAEGRIRAERRPGGSYRIPAEQFRDPGA
jgi:excisionase family DNA binding protein